MAPPAAPDGKLAGFIKMRPGGPHKEGEGNEDSVSCCVRWRRASRGTVTISAGRNAPETAPIQAGDAIPILLNDIHSFENTGGEPLEFMIVGVSRDSNKRTDNDAQKLPRRGD